MQKQEHAAHAADPDDVELTDEEWYEMVAGWDDEDLDLYEDDLESWTTNTDTPLDDVPLDWLVPW